LFINTTPYGNNVFQGGLQSTLQISLLNKSFVISQQLIPPQPKAMGMQKKGKVTVTPTGMF
jgi:hypothetical protein